MKRILTLALFMVFFSPVLKAQDTLIFRGQLSAWCNVNSGSTLPVWTGGRYLPQLNYEIRKPESRLWDAELSANIYGMAGFRPFDSLTSDGKIKPYRAWIRYSAPQLEFRLGLQKINFGSAAMLRPLMWFDGLDPRDPLQVTDGVWGGLGRYYFLNNTTLWFWTLYGNKNPRGWDAAGTAKGWPEIGGRAQFPVPKGELAFSFHSRKADTRLVYPGITGFASATENHIGIDGKWDVGPGLWFESSWTGLAGDHGNFTNREMITLGIDYTFAIGNGLHAQLEQLLVSNDHRALEFDSPGTFSGISLSYPTGMFGNLSGIVYLDDKNRQFFNFVNWQYQTDHFTLHLMFFSNPKDRQLPQFGDTANIFAGNGMQLMLVYNH